MQEWCLSIDLLKARDYTLKTQQRRLTASECVCWSLAACVICRLPCSRMTE